MKDSNPREIYMTLLIFILGSIMCALAFISEDSGPLLLGLSPLMMMYPLIVGFTKFSTWVDYGKDHHDTSSN